MSNAWEWQKDQAKLVLIHLGSLNQHERLQLREINYQLAKGALDPTGELLSRLNAFYERFYAEVDSHEAEQI